MRAGSATECIGLSATAGVKLGLPEGVFMGPNQGFCPKKRRGQARPDEEERGLRASVANLLSILQSVFEPKRAAGGFDMHCGEEERVRMIDWLWGGNYASATREMLHHNPELATFIEERTKHGHTPANPQALVAADRRRGTRHNFLSGILGRNRSKDFVPEHQLLLSVQAHAKQINVHFWDMLSSVRVLLSRNWVDKLIDDAMKRYPGCSYEQLDWISAAVFDNYTAQFNYDARHTADTQGERIDMTNWTSIYLPKSTLPHIDLGQLAGTPLQQTFKHGFDLDSIGDLCMPDHPDLVLYRRDRWTESFANIRAGTFFDRPDYTPPHAHECYYQPPIPGKLQSSAEHVEEEADIIIEAAQHKYCKWVILGGDGLAINRINHMLARKWGKYLAQFPVVIPIQGEHPHATAHVLHGGWRPYWPLLQTLLQDIGHSECKGDWTVASFNDYDHGICILIEGVAQYFLHLDKSGGGPDIEDMGPFLAECTINNDLQWLSRFLADFGFLYWYLRQAIRSNDSATIDLTWRESISFMHTTLANKTQYAPMAVMRVFWAEALCPTLAQVYHKNRTLSMLGLRGSNVGYDMWQEKGNLFISQNVIRPSQERIAAFLHELNFTGHVSRNMEKVLLSERKRDGAKMVKIKKDVQGVVDSLITRVGNTWAEVLVEIEWGDTQLINPPRSNKPWEAVKRGEDSLKKWVNDHVRSKVTWPMP